MRRHCRFGSCRRGAVRLLILALVLAAGAGARAEVVESSKTGFKIEHELILPISPEDAFDVMTGDISGWWDHSMSGSPKKLHIEPRPGGGFMEIFDDEGNGVLHATVIYAHRGKLLRFEGPLGLSGNAITMVTTYEYEPHEEGARVKVTAVAAGKLAEGWDEAVNGAWYHFLFERLKPHIESGAYRD